MGYTNPNDLPLSERQINALMTTACEAARTRGMIWGLSIKADFTHAKCCQTVDLVTKNDGIYTVVTVDYAGTQTTWATRNLERDKVRHG